MRKRSRWLACAALLVAVLPLSLMAASASAATAHTSHLTAAAHMSAAQHLSAAQHRDRLLCPNHGAVACCIPDNDGDCLHTVHGTAWPIGGVNIRTGPGTGYNIVNTMPQNSGGTVYCYATGTNINGDPYWDQITSSYGSGYVADYYFYTAGNINQQVDPC